LFVEEFEKRREKRRVLVGVYPSPFERRLMTVDKARRLLLM
jgi:hypothetical protein